MCEVFVFVASVDFLSWLTVKTDTTKEKILRNEAFTLHLFKVFEPAAKAFKLNNSEATVFTDDCNLLLKNVIDGKVNIELQLFSQPFRLVELTDCYDSI